MWLTYSNYRNWQFKHNSFFAAMNVNFVLRT